MSVATDQLHDHAAPDPADPTATAGGWSGVFLTDADPVDGTARVKLPGYATDRDFEALGIAPHDAVWPVTGDECVCVFDDQFDCWAVAWRTV